MIVQGYLPIKQLGITYFPMPNLEMNWLNQTGRLVLLGLNYQMDTVSCNLIFTLKMSIIYNSTRNFHPNTSFTGNNMCSEALSSGNYCNYARSARKYYLYFAGSHCSEWPYSWGTTGKHQYIIERCDRARDEIPPYKIGTIFSKKFDGVDVLNPEEAFVSTGNIFRAFSMEPPGSGSHLQKFLGTVQWVRIATPTLSNLKNRTHLPMMKVYKAAEKRPNYAVAKVQLDIHGCPERKQKCFRGCGSALVNQSTLHSVVWLVRALPRKLHSWIPLARARKIQECTLRLH